MAPTIPEDTTESSSFAPGLISVLGVEDVWDVVLADRSVGYTAPMSDLSFIDSFLAGFAVRLVAILPARGTAVTEAALVPGFIVSNEWFSGVYLC